MECDSDSDFQNEGLDEAETEMNLEESVLCDVGSSCPDREKLDCDLRDEEVNDDDDEEEASEYDDFFSKHPSAMNESWYKRYAEHAGADRSGVDNEVAASGSEECDESGNEEIEQPSRVVFVPPSMRNDAPLASMLHDEKLDALDPRIFFPNFDFGLPMKASTLLAASLMSSSRPKIWWPAKTFRPNPTLDDALNKEGLKLIFGPPVPPEGLEPCSDTLSIQPIARRKESHTYASFDQRHTGIPPWRIGPGKYWFDRYDVPFNVHSYDYGFKLKRENQSRKQRSSPRREKSDQALHAETEDNNVAETSLPPEAFLPVNLVHWEDDIIYDSEQARQQSLKRIASGKLLECGWIPTMQTRTYESFMAAYNSKSFEQMLLKPTLMIPLRMVDIDISKKPSANYSLFPMDNFEFFNTNWEDGIIWDSESMMRIPEPYVLTLDYSDDPTIFGIPEDKSVEEKPVEENPAPKSFDRKARHLLEHQFTKKSKMILGQVQQRQKQEEDEQMESSVVQTAYTDPFNLSSDDYYMPKNVEKSLNAVSVGSFIQHSIPAQNLHCTFFPTHLNPNKLRHFHRYPLPKRAIRRAIDEYVSIKTLTKHIRETEESRKNKRALEGGGEIFFMREIADLSGKDGALVLMEYSEEHPPLLNQTGMCSKIRNYFKRKLAKEAEPAYEFGEPAFTSVLPFLGSFLSTDQPLQSIENNMYRAPIYQHKHSNTDFLLIRIKQQFYIRPCPVMYVVGQECPLHEVPSPNSKRATTFVRDFLLAFIYRLFLKSDTTPNRLKMEDIKASFPHYAESSVRKRLKQCSYFHRTGQGSEQNYWILRDDFRLPSMEEVVDMVTPEMCCAQYSMLATEQRLKDAGYGEKYFFTPENEDDSDDQVTIEDEIKCAPWNTVRAYIAAMKGKCLLDQTGIADPTGCGEGFSYVKVSSKPQKTKEELPSVPKRLVTGTNADLRKLPLKEAKEICRTYGVREEEINALSRWEIIDVIRTLSTQAAKAKSDFSGMARFARGNIRFNSADMQERYTKFCQRTFDLQNRTLSNPLAPSTDEGSSGEDSDNEELACKLESMLNTDREKKSIVDSKKLEYEQEERERKALQQMLHGGTSSFPNSVTKERTMQQNIVESCNSTSISARRKLKIYRTYKNADGTESIRIEVITRPQLIDAYQRIRSTRDDTFIHVYAQMDEQYREEKRKEKRRLQDQLRRIRRNEIKARLNAADGHASNKAKSAEKQPVVIKPNLMKMRCSACHGTGHMKTNRNCPLYGKDLAKDGKNFGDSSLLTDEESERFLHVPHSEMIAVEGTKLKISRKVCNMSDSTRRNNPLKIHIPRELITKKQFDSSSSCLPSPADSKASSETASIAASTEAHSSGKSRKRGTADMDDLWGPAKCIRRRRADPKVTMSIQLNEVFVDMRAVPGSEDLFFPVNAKKVPDYYFIIKVPMDLQQIKKKIDACKYELRREFLADVNQILYNSWIYNGENHVISETAKKVLEVASRGLADREEELFSLEKSINPLLDDNDIIGFSFILNDIIQECKRIPKSVAFHAKVDAKKVPLYYHRIGNPMDLGTMEEKIKHHKYTTIESFMLDMLQIKRNSEIYNGLPELSQYTAKAFEIYQRAEELVEVRRSQLVELESNIQVALKDRADAESVTTSSVVFDDNEPMSEMSETNDGKEELKQVLSEDRQENDAFDNIAPSCDEIYGKEGGAFVDLLMSDEENEVGKEGGGAFEDLLMSDDHEDDDDAEQGGAYDAESDLLQSRMHTSGQLAAELEMSDSTDEEDDDFLAAKMPKLDDLETL